MKSLMNLYFVLCKANRGYLEEETIHSSCFVFCVFTLVTSMEHSELRGASIVAMVYGIRGLWTDTGFVAVCVGMCDATNIRFTI
jgi:hypothetical protein